MPIRRENRKRYPLHWPELSRSIRFGRAAGRCECKGECGEDHAGRCAADHGEAHPITGSRVVLTVAHLNHQPECNMAENLRAMCQRCHNRYDSATRKAGTAQRRQLAARRIQPDLFV